MPSGPVEPQLVDVAGDAVRGREVDAAMGTGGQLPDADGQDEDQPPEDGRVGGGAGAGRKR